MQKHHTTCKSLYFCNLLLFLLSLNLCFTSCTSPKKLLYFKNLPADTTLQNVVTKDFELKIRKGDLINIGVSSLSNEASAVFTAPQIAGTSGQLSGYLVDINGNILYPKLGIVHAEGLTRDELKNRLLKDLQPYLKEPVVTVSFVNNKIIFMGEINQVLYMQNETMTILEAISLGGGIPATGRKDNILVIRENGKDKEFKRLNLNNSSVFTSPFYYLKPNDILYIEPDAARTGSGKTQQILSYVSAGISLLFLILSRIK
ncbi:MAG: polysaccharide biosynthesis/export family protein [Ginsengibacter sp.]